MHSSRTKRSVRGFTIVELLIVIVIIAILATITIVAFNGIQQRARDSSRTSAVEQIQKGLELYRQTHDRYPPHISPGANIPSGFTGVWGTSYSYSVATDDSWLKNLLSDGVVATAPLDPVNDNSHYFVYWSSGTTGLGKCTEPFYVLTVVGYESPGGIPANSRQLTCTWGGATANWTVSSSRAIFSNITTPPDP